MSTIWGMTSQISDSIGSIQFLEEQCRAAILSNGKSGGSCLRNVLTSKLRPEKNSEKLNKSRVLK